MAALERPDLILAPSAADAHQDHRTSARSCRPFSVISSTSPTRSPSGMAISAGRQFTSRCRDDMARRKVELLDKCYPSQRGRDWWDDEVFLGLARLRGMECRARYAEAFTCNKLIIR